MSSPLSNTQLDSGQLTFFEQPKDDNASNSSSVLQYVMNFFASKKDSKLTVKDVKSNESLAPSRPSLLNFSQSTRRQKTTKTLSHNPGSEVELRLQSLSTIIREFPKLVKGPQGTDQDEHACYSNQGEDSTPDSFLSPSLSATELRQYWMPDEQCHECYECGEKFTTFRRRHHCRICGQIFCSRCCNQLIPGTIMGLPGMLRSCSYCWKLVSAFSEGNTPKSGLTFSHTSGAPKMEATGKDDSSLFGGATNESMLSFGSTSQSIMQSESNTSLKKITLAASASKHDTVVGDEEFLVRGPYDTLHPSTLLSPAKENYSSWNMPGYIFDATPELTMPDMPGNYVEDDLVQDSTQLHSLWRKISDDKQGIEFRGHRFRLRKYSNCITGQELIDWLIRNDVASTRAQGCAIGQALYEGKWLKPVVDIGGVFQDGYVLFQNGNRPPNIGIGNRIEIYPDHFANFPEEGDSSGLQTYTRHEPIWVQEIKCEGDDEVDGVGNEDDVYRDDTSESELTWSDAPNNLEEALLYSDEDKSISERSVVSLSSFVEIDEGNDVIKYTRPSTPEKFSRALAQQSSSHFFQPEYDDSCPTNISADYLRNLIAWNGNSFGQPLVKPSPGWRESDLQSAAAESQDKRAFQWLREMYLRHNLTFLRQLLRDKGLDLSWAEVLVPLAKHAAQHITPNPNVNMDVCHYFQIKKVADGPRSGSEIVNGVVCTKNVVHKQMKTDISNPSLLLLAIPLEYQRVQLKLAALDPIVRQEREFYKHLISRITARHPQVVLVQCTVSHLAQELLLQAGITLVINVKQSVMERVARSTEADIVYSIDQLIQAKLGRCSRFFVKHHQISLPNDQKRKVDSRFTVKTLMYFDGCNPKYGCTAILRGRNHGISAHKDTSKELSDIQVIFRFLVRTMYHARLELSYLIDQHNFGKLLKKHSSAKQMQRNRSESESTAKNSENDFPSESSVNTVNEAKKLKNIVKHLSNVIISSDGEDGSLQSEPPPQKLTLLPSNFADCGRSCIEIPPNSPSASANRCHFEESVKSTLLCISPLLQPQLPFLFSSRGQNSSIQKFLPNKLFWSQSFNPKCSKLQKFSSIIDMEHRGAIRSRSSTMESLLPLDRSWLSPPHQSSKPVHPTEADDTVASGANSESSFGSREIPGESTAATVQQMKVPNSHATCYSQQYKQLRTDRLSATSDVSMQLSGDAKLHTWEQRLLDIVFGPPTFLRNEKRERFVLSPEYSPNNSPSAKRRRHFVFANQLSSTCTSDTALKFDVRNVVDSENIPHHLHDFVTSSLTESASSDIVKDLLASFRAHAGFQDSRREPSVHSNEEDNASNDVDANGDESWSNHLLPPDCMDPVNHQHICALFSSYSPQSPNAPYFCVQPWVVDIDFYRGNDITLGGFLERYCFRPSYHCPSATCRRPMVEHIRSFVHGNMCMTVVLKELSKPFQQSCIMTWSWDWMTKKSSDVKTLSHDTWSMSFAKYLELNLGQLAIPDCGSSPHFQKGQLKQDIFSEEWELRPSESFQYFLFRDVVAAFKCFLICIKEVQFPSFKLLDFSSDTALQTCQLSDEIHEDAPTYSDFNSSIESLGERILEMVETIYDCIQTSRMTPPDEILVTRDKFYSDLTNSLARGKARLLEELDFLKSLLESDPKLSSGELSHDSVFDSWEEDRLDIYDPPLPDELAGEISVKILHLKCELSEMIQEWNGKLADAHEKDRSSFWTSGRQTKPGGSPQPQKKQTENASNDMNRGMEASDVTDSIFSGDFTDEVNDLVSSLKAPSDYEHKTKRDYNAAKLKRGSTEGWTSDRAPSYKRLSRTGSSVKFLVTRLLPGNTLLRSLPMPFPPDEHFLLPECLTTNIVVRDAEPSSIIAYTLSSKNYKSVIIENAASNKKKSEVSAMIPDLENKPAVQTIGKLSGVGLDQPPTSSEKTCLEVPGNYVLKSEIDHLEAEDSHEASVDSVQSLDSSVSVNSPHIEIQFSDATTRFYCKIYFATLFENFRSKVLAGGEAQYLRSLSRSAKWLARGGKSGSTFYKTKDDQFILKQMSYFELQSFLEFAPKYVEYITSCIENQEATTISKILGVYRISFRNSVTSRSLKQDVLVIENLFYKRKIGQIFDLKGSVRNRHVKENASKETPDVSSHIDQGDIVLQDSNLLKMMCENPIYVHEHTKFLLMNAIIRDTEFLSRNFIMDYSLLVGIEENDQIIAGIIDFIRTFTWNKKLEMVVKWSSSRSMPTVVSPELYKNRFCEAMGQYFQVAPDRWYGMHAY